VKAAMGGGRKRRETGWMLGRLEYITLADRVSEPEGGRHDKVYGESSKQI